MSNITIAGERLHQIILAPLVSEKSTRVAEKLNQAVFKVALDAKKPEIKLAVEKLFNVNVVSVQTLIAKGKKKVGRSEGPPRIEIYRGSDLKTVSP